MAKKVLVAIAEGSEELEAVSIVNVLRRAGVSVTIASVSTRQVKCSRGVNLVADKLIGDCVNENYDMIAIPGGLPGAYNLRDSAQLKEMLLKQKKENRYYAAVCASPAVVFQTHGLLEGHQATCYPSFSKDLKDFSTSTVVVDGYCVTSQGPGTSLEFSLKLVELLCGLDKAKEIAGNMLIKYE